VSEEHLALGHRETVERVAHADPDLLCAEEARSVRTGIRNPAKVAEEHLSPMRCPLAVVGAEVHRDPVHPPFRPGARGVERGPAPPCAQPDVGGEVFPVAFWDAEPCQPAQHDAEHLRAKQTRGRGSTRGVER
jgi:hypothetical protein